ncbi:hypothetical protein ACQPXS_41815 [Streptomyces sp. CA-142005]|uniref:hypothetical protein n=1 Tax=Streptomyces sp. CA-142005 TaxID=3240052 RepID=UPI003D8ADE8B
MGTGYPGRGRARLVVPPLAWRSAVAGPPGPEETTGATAPWTYERAPRLERTPAGNRWGHTAGPAGPARRPGRGGGRRTGPLRADGRPAPPPRPLPRSRPTSFRIPSLGINAPVAGVRLNEERQLETPPVDNPKLAGWYEGGPTPGETGTAVAVGHRDTRTGGRSTPGTHGWPPRPERT